MKSLILLTDMTKKAFIFAFDKHKNQVDKANMPYIYHLLSVANKQKDEMTTTIALLHDVLEDTDTTRDELLKLFPSEVIDTVELLTHKEDEDYFVYIKRICKNPLARSVKLADLQNNLDKNRLYKITQKDKERLRKYRKAIKIIKTSY